MAASKFGKTRLLDPANSALDGQARVNAEIFTAVEILGRKLERVEGERDRLAQRLALIESAATVDEKTGKLYLPVLVNGHDLPQRAPETPKWLMAATLMSSAVALCALGLVLFRAPAPVLTQEQLAALNSLSTLQFAQLSPESKGWKNLAATEPQLPQQQELAQLEQAAETPTPIDAQPASATLAPQTPAQEEVKIAGTPQEAAPQAVTAPAAEPATAKIAETAPVEKKQLAPPPLSEAPPQKTAHEATPAAESDIAPDKSLKGKLAELQERALQGVPEAQHDLATLYAAGSLAPQDYGRAIRWFEKSAEGGIANAHYNLGVIHQQGLGVPVNLAAALDWYERAAEIGHPEAMYNLGIAYIEGIGTKADIPRGVSYFKRAANAGVAQAAYNLGVLYESSFIGPIDTQKAMEWYRAAAKQGHEDAKTALARLKDQSGGRSPATASSDSNNTALSLADKVEPAAGKASGPKTLLADIQRILIKRGLLPGKPDGVLNQETEDAIRSAQQKFGLVEDGQPSPELLETLLQAPPSE
jgi:TPR repeat protein